jgi:hypothetical protein
MQAEITNGIHHTSVNRLPGNIPAGEPRTAPIENDANGRGPDGNFIPLDSLLASLLPGGSKLLPRNLPSGPSSAIGDNGATARPQKKKKRRK